MGILAAKQPKGAAQSNTQIINGVRVNQSTYGTVVPVPIGPNRIPMSLIGLWDFLRTAHTTPGQKVGKGLGGGGSTPATTSYTYSTAFQSLLGYGPIDHIDAVWTSAGKVPTVAKSTNFTVPGGGGFIDIVDGGYRGDKGVGATLAYSQAVNDFGANNPTTLTGTFSSAMIAGTVSAPGVYVISTPVAGTTRYTFHPSDAGKQVVINYTSTLATVTLHAEIVIPASATYTVDDPSNYVGNSVVKYLNTGNQFFGPGDHSIAGHYTVDSSGNFTFASADIGQQVLITYQSHDPNTDASAVLNYTLIGGTNPQSVWSYLTGHHQTDALSHPNIATIQSSDLELGSSASMPQLSFEGVATKYMAGAGIKGANPVDVITAILTDPVWGINFPANQIGDWTNARSFWQANGFFISLLQDSQSTGMDVITQILDAGQGAMFRDPTQGNKLMIAVYGDTSAAGNGAVFVADTQPVVELSVDDMVAAGGKEPVVVETTPEQNIYNKVKVEFLNADNDYNTEVVVEDDPASIQLNGLHEEGQQSWHFIRSVTVAQWAANLRLKRMTNIRDTYKMTITTRYRHMLRLLKLVTVTWSAMGWSQKPMRIIKIGESHAGLDLILEEFPYGIAKPTLYPKQTPQAINSNPALVYPGNTDLIALEVPDALNGYAGRVVRMYASPQTPNNWGGCEIFTSNDNVDFTPAGQITAPVVLGTLQATMPVGTGDPDTQSIQVTVTNGVQFPASNAADFDDFVSLLAVIDAGGTVEIMAYKNATLTGVNTYTIDTFHRGLYGTTRAAHSSGATVIELGEAFVEVQYPSNRDGTTMYVKAASFNTMQGRLQDVGTLTAVAITLTGDFPGFFDKDTGTLVFDKVTDTTNYKKTTPHQIQYIDPTTGKVPASTMLNPQGGLVPGVGIPCTVNITPTSIEVITVNQTRWFGDGSTITVLASDTTFSSLGNSTTYYLYMRFNVTTGAVSFSHGTGTPPTAPDDHLAALTQFDGFSSLGLLIVTTQASGGTGGGGGGSENPGGACPEGNELVDVKERGIVPVKTVIVGEHVLGLDLKTGEDVYRRVLNVVKRPCATWRTVDGHRVTQRETVYKDSMWKPAYWWSKVIDFFVGTTVKITVEASDYDDRNYWLVSAPRLLTHNFLIERS